ncbi:MAG: SDR family oxidoreductase [Anaerolineae bacterium]|jgi:3-dehydrosphinganine reductase
MRNGDATFKGKNVIITGGSSGIGKATAKLLAGEGANVFIIARNRQNNNRALQEIRTEGSKPGHQCGAFCADVASYEQVVAAVAAIVEAGGVPDILINCAGMVYPGYFEELPLSTFRHQMDVNYFGTLHTVRAVLPYMMSQGRGHIVNVSSMGGVGGTFGYTAYAASKFAVRGFTEALRVEMKPHGVRVSLVLPPDTDTPQLRQEREIQPPELKMITGGVKPKHLGCPSEFIAYWLMIWVLTDNGEPMSPDRVAGAILKGIRRGKPVIVPDATLRMGYLLRGFLVPLWNWAQDNLAGVARRELGA